MSAYRVNMGHYKAKFPRSGDPACHTIFVGHNPSMTTWATGHYFANPSNRFWGLLHTAGLSPEPEAHQDEILTKNYGFGFCDVVEIPGNDAKDFSRSLMHQNTPVFMERIEKYAFSMNGTLRRICFIGKRQWKHLFDDPLQRCEHGLQASSLRPEQWPDSLAGVDVWIMPSPSGRAVLSTPERLATYIDLAAEIRTE